LIVIRDSYPLLLSIVFDFAVCVSVRMNYLKKVLFTINDSILSPKEKQVINDIKKFLSVISESTGRTRLKAVKEIARLCDVSENKEMLCQNEELSLLHRLKTFLSIIKYDDNCIYWIIGCLNMLSSGSSTCKTIIASDTLDLLPVLMKILSSSSDEKMIMVIEMTISNCSQCETCHSYLLSSSIGWLDHLVRRLLEKSYDYHSYLLFNNFIANMKNSNILIMNLERNIPEILFQKLFSFGSLEKKWVKEDHEIADLIIRSIMHLSKSGAGSNYIRNCFHFHPQYSSFFFELLSSSAFTLIGIRVNLIIANIYGPEEADEKGRKKALLEMYPEIFYDLCDVMNCILNYNVEKGEIKMMMKKGFVYGGISLSDVVIALKNLMISDENKQIIRNKCSRLLVLSFQGIKLFLENAGECKGMNPGEAFYELGGGGGKDHLTLESLLELLLQFSFIFENDKELQNAFSSLSLSPSSAASSPSSSASYDLKKMLEELLSLPNDRNVSPSSKQFARFLLTKLDSSKKRGGIVGGIGDFFNGNNSSNINSAKHIMLSYCSSSSSSLTEKELVIDFGKQLKEMGYDVWRDEEGSSLMPSLLPENIDHISHVIDKSYAIIIFLSSEYKENALCRMEGNLAYMKAMNSSNSSPPQLIYVMMNEHYTTRSHPRQIDGWLTNLITNDSTWYPLWNKDFLDSTLLSIVDELGNNGKVTLNTPFSLKPLSHHVNKGSAVAVTSSSVAMNGNPSSTPSKNSSASSSTAAVRAASSSSFTLKFPSPMKRSPSSAVFCFSPVSRSHSSSSSALSSSSSSASTPTPPTPSKDMFQSIFSMKLDDDADFTTAFHCLTEDKSICRESFRNVLKSLNVSEPEDLQFADMATILGISGLLKPRYRHIFFKALHLEY
jgi:hypothetical protein